MNFGDILSNPDLLAQIRSGFQQAGGVAPSAQLDPQTAPSGPGGVSQILQVLRGLKQRLTAGQINSADYLKQATPFVQNAQRIVEGIAGQGSSAASSVNPIWQQFQDENFVKSDQGKWLPGLPVTEQEFANLPDSAKPTADQINKGLVPATTLPGNVALNTQITQQQQSQQDLAQQAIQQAQQRQSDTQGQLKSMYDQFYNSTQQRYDQGYQDLASSLQNQMQEAQQNLTDGPQGEELRQYYNNLGLLNSGAFNQGLGNAFGEIEQNTQNQLLQAKLNEQNALQGAASQGMGALTNFGVGAEQQLQDIANQGYQTQSGLGQSGLQRQFSLQDFFMNSDLQRQLADLQNNRYMSAINQSQQNPWAQLGLGFATGAGAGLGSYFGKKFG